MGGGVKERSGEAEVCYSGTLLIQTLKMWTTHYNGLCT